MEVTFPKFFEKGMVAGTSIEIGILNLSFEILKPCPLLVSPSEIRGDPCLRQPCVSLGRRIEFRQSARASLASDELTHLEKEKRGARRHARENPERQRKRARRSR